MANARHIADGTIVLGDGEREIAVPAAELANLHQHLGFILADRVARVRAVANSALPLNRECQVSAETTSTISRRQNGKHSLRESTDA